MAALEMKFVLILVILAYAESTFSQKVEKDEKKDSVAKCWFCPLQHPNKPSAHIEAVNKHAVTYQAITVITDWSVSAPHSHLAGGMTYSNGKLTVPISGRYYIYAHLFYHSKGNGGRVLVRVNNNIVTMIQPLDSGVGQGTEYAGGVFYLRAGDRISLAAGHTITLFMYSFHSYFGAFLI